MAKRLIAGIETGGTKLLARISDLTSGETVAEGRWETGSADEAVRDLGDFLASATDKGELAAAGIAAFGPIVICPASPDHGKMLATPKPGWAGSNLRAELETRFDIPIAVDSDVNAAAVAEQAIGAGEGLPAVAYVTVGTGIGAGLAVHGKSLKGALHPEAGHLPIIRRDGDPLASVCPFHSNCAEGLASGRAIRARLAPGQELADDSDLVEWIADYLGQLGASMVLAWSPHRIVWGGGAIAGSALVPQIERKLRTALGGYGVGPAVEQAGFCVEARLKDAGLEGALLMARHLVE